MLWPWPRRRRQGHLAPREPWAAPPCPHPRAASAHHLAPSSARQPTGSLAVVAPVRPRHPRAVTVLARTPPRSCPLQHAYILCTHAQRSYAQIPAARRLPRRVRAARDAAVDPSRCHSAAEPRDELAHASAHPPLLPKARRSPLSPPPARLTPWPLCPAT